MERFQFLGVSNEEHVVNVLILNRKDLAGDDAPFEIVKNGWLVVDPPDFNIDGNIRLLVQTREKSTDGFCTCDDISECWRFATAIRCCCYVVSKHLLQFYHVAALQHFEVLIQRFHLVLVGCDVQIAPQFRLRAALDLTGTFSSDSQNLRDFVMRIVESFFENEDCALFAVELLEKNKHRV